MDRPKPVPTPDFSRLIALTESGLNASIDNQYEDEDFAHFVYEEAMTAIYGPNFFAWRNQQKW